MQLKAKGLNAERELVRRFNEAGWRAVRVAGSGSIKWPAPDVIATRGERRLVIECKTTAANAQYLTSKQMSELQEFSQALLAEPWVAVRFSKTPWLFVALADLQQTPENFVVTQELARRRGVLFEELTSS